MQRMTVPGGHYKMRRLFLFLTLSAVFIACSKNAEENCNQLKEAALANNVEEINSIITEYILALPSANYNQPNIRLLAKRISNCNISTAVPCYDCIKTLPSQTEISLDFVYNGTPVHKMIDLSYSPDKRIVFRNIHD